MNQGTSNNFGYKSLMCGVCCITVLALFIPKLNLFKKKKEENEEENMLSYLSKDKRKEMDFLIERLKDEGLDLENCGVENIFFQLTRTSNTVNELKEQIYSQIDQISSLKNELENVNLRSQAESKLRQDIDVDKNLYEDEMIKKDEEIKELKMEKKN